jgi:hypothetical protein
MSRKASRNKKNEESQELVFVFKNIRQKVHNDLERDISPGN